MRLLIGCRKWDIWSPIENMTMKFFWWVQNSIPIPLKNHDGLFYRELASRVNFWSCHTDSNTLRVNRIHTMIGNTSRWGKGVEDSRYAILFLWDTNPCVATMIRQYCVRWVLDFRNLVTYRIYDIIPAQMGNTGVSLTVKDELGDTPSTFVVVVLKCNFLAETDCTSLYQQVEGTSAIINADLSRIISVERLLTTATGAAQRTVGTIETSFSERKPHRQVAGVDLSVWS